MITIMAHELNYFETNFIGGIYDQHNKNSKRGLNGQGTSLEMADVDWIPHSSPEHFINYVLTPGPQIHKTSKVPKTFLMEVG